jgi:putative peptidoglycan lipid II flippase
MPAIVFIVVLRAHIVRIILGSGEFSWADTRLTAALLALFAFSLIAQSALLIFSRAYYAARLTLVPILVNVGGTLAAAAAAYFGVAYIEHAPFVRLFIEAMFRVDDVPGTSVLIIPLAYSVVMIIAASTSLIRFLLLIFLLISARGHDFTIFLYAPNLII